MQTSEPISVPQGAGGRAFTLVELLVIVAVLALLALCMLPALARTSPDTRAFRCLNNHRQLARAWRLYADDNNERFAGVTFGGSTKINDPNAPWVQGWLTWDVSPDITNTVFLADPRYASLANYFGRDSRIVKCPADQFVSSVQRNLGRRQRVRSVAANIYLGGVNVGMAPSDPLFAVPRKWSDLTTLKPADAWLFADEHPDSINDPALLTPRATQWVDLPGNLHDGGAGVAFADGSAEIHRWQGSALDNPVRFVFTVVPVLPNDPDIEWLRARTPQRP